MVHIHSYVGIRSIRRPKSSIVYRPFTKMSSIPWIIIRTEIKKIWISELGCPGMRDPGTTANWWLGTNTSEHKQAEWVKTIYGAPLQWKNLEKIFWAFFRDTDDHFKTGVDNFGLIRKDFSKKPAFDAYREMSHAKVS